jgi:hypothetical protein
MLQETYCVLLNDYTVIAVKFHTPRYSPFFIISYIDAHVNTFWTKPGVSSIYENEGIPTQSI